MERLWEHTYVEPHHLACCKLCETEVELDWGQVRSIVLAHDWIETSWTQKLKWTILMDDSRNLTSRARIYPRDGAVELRFERYHTYSPAIFGRSDFAILADFDFFWAEINSIV